jgi:hypothetical protein
MRRTVLILIAGIVALAAVPVALATTGATTARVSPGKGGIHTQFHFSMRLPTATGTTGTTGRATRSDSIEISGPSHAGCVSGATWVLPSAGAGTMARETFNPGRLGGRWCSGTFRGEVLERVNSVCGPPMVMIICPQLEIAPQVIARFSFRVT